MRPPVGMLAAALHRALVEESEDIPAGEVVASGGATC